MQKEKQHTTYRFTISHDESHDQLWVRRYNTQTLWIYGTIIAVIVVGIIFSLIAFTPIRTVIPGYPNSRTRAVAVQNAIKIDSLETIITRWQLYSENLRRVVDGEAPLNIDSVLRSSSPSDSQSVFDASALLKRDSLLRETVTRSEQFEVSDNARKLPVDAQHFFTPVKGVVSRAYDQMLHPYVNISAPPGSLVLSALDGTVLFTGWNEESGYTIIVQHPDDIVTVYIHNQKLLKNVGDKVAAGSPLALLGSTGLDASEAHLHFELWLKGEALDPSQYINL